LDDEGGVGRGAATFSKGGLEPWRVLPGDGLVLTFSFDPNSAWPTPAFDLSLAKHFITS
jgi:hypothetical protein